MRFSIIRDNNKENRRKGAASAAQRNRNKKATKLPLDVLHSMKKARLTKVQNVHHAKNCQNCYIYFKKNYSDRLEQLPTMTGYWIVDSTLVLVRDVRT